MLPLLFLIRYKMKARLAVLHAFTGSRRKADTETLSVAKIHHWAHSRNISSDVRVQERLGISGFRQASARTKYKCCTSKAYKERKSK